MSDTAQDRSIRTTTLGGALTALSGLLLLVMLVADGDAVLSALAAVALAAGTAVLAITRGAHGVVGDSRLGRIALVVFGFGPLAFLLPSAPLPLPPVVVGMSVLAVVTIATVVAAVAVVRAGILRGIARWALVAVAADALLIAVMSSVQLGALPIVYTGWHLELIRPVALLIWGLAVVHHGRATAIRRRVSGALGAWRRSTDVGGAASEAMQDHPERV